jgi:hypothetical protein
MTTSFETLAKTQKEVLESLANTAKETLETSYNALSAPVKQTTDLVAESLKAQQALINESLQIKDASEAISKSPEFFQKWLALQNEFVQKWINLYEEGTGTQLNLNKENAAKFSTSFKQAYTEWEALIAKAYKSVSEGGLELDERVKELPGMANFIKVYESLHEYWKPILEKGVMKGMISRENFDKVFPQENFTKIFDSLVGLNSVENLQKTTETFQKFFDSYIEKVNEVSQNAKKTSETYFKNVGDMYKGTPAEPLYTIYADFLGSLTDVKPVFGKFDLEAQSKKVNENILKGRQLYISYLEKNLNFQQKVYGISKKALTDNIEKFWELYQKEGKTPAYDEFVASWLKSTQENFSEILNSGELTSLKTELKSTGEQLQKVAEEMLGDLTKTASVVATPTPKAKKA